MKQFKVVVPVFFLVGCAQQTIKMERALGRTISAAENQIVDEEPGEASVDETCCNLNADLTSNNCTEGFLNGLGYSVEKGVYACGYLPPRRPPIFGDGEQAPPAPNPKNADMEPLVRCLRPQAKFVEHADSVSATHRFECDLELYLLGPAARSINNNVTVKLELVDLLTGEVVQSEERDVMCVAQSSPSDNPHEARCSVGRWTSGPQEIRREEWQPALRFHFSVFDSELNTDPENDVYVVELAGRDLQIMETQTHCDATPLGDVADCQVVVGNTGFRDAHYAPFNYVESQRDAAGALVLETGYVLVAPGLIEPTQFGKLPSELVRGEQGPSDNPVACVLVGIGFSGYLGGTMGNVVYCSPSTQRCSRIRNIGCPGFGG